MRRSSPETTVPAAALLAIAVMTAGGACGCEGSAPASTGPVDRAARIAREWTGSHETPGRPVVGETPPVSKGTWVLHVGDSFVHASLWQNLRPRFAATGTEYVVEAATSTYTTTWANDAELEKWLDRRPSLVLVTLGANEVDMPVPEEHAHAVEQLVRKIAAASTSCVWITPPMWKKDTGILQVIHDHGAPCLFFDSDAVIGGLHDDERQRDHIHPNERGGARWAGAVWDWLRDHRDASRPAWALVPYEQRGS
jgi:hypothetical protein